MSAGAVIYVRVSTPDQVDNYSLETQEEACLEYCKQRGIEVIRIFREEGASATSLSRPQLKELLYYCAEHRKNVDYVLVHRVDRFARDVGDHQVVRQALAELGIALRAVQEDFDDSAQGRLVENLFAVLAQFDNDQRAERVSAGMQKGLEHGRWMWRPPIGYRKPSTSDKSPSLIPDEELAPLVRLAFELMAAGSRSAKEVLAEVTALGLRRKGKGLSVQAFGQLLRNPIYKGTVSSPKSGFIGPGDFEPIVSAELYERVQRALESRNRGNTAKRQWNHPDFPLRRVIRCHSCGGPLTGSWSTGRSARYAYYRCYRQNCVSFRREKLEAVLEHELEQLSVSESVLALLDRIVRDAWDDAHRVALTRATKARDRIQNLEHRHQQLIEAHVHQGSIDAATYAAQKESIDGELARLREPDAPLPGEAELKAALARASGLIGDLRGYWNRLEGQSKHRFLAAIFPSGISCASENIGTTKEPRLVYENSLPDVVGEALVGPAGFEPATSSLSGMIMGIRRHWRVGDIACVTTSIVAYQFALFVDVSRPLADAMWTRASLVARFA